jgi:hypothetical protein
MLARPAIAALFLGALTAGCGPRTGGVGCGLATVAGQSMLLEEFRKPGTTLSVLPANIPATLPIRVALGPAFRSVVGRADSMLVVGLEGSLPVTPEVGWGILAVSPAGVAEGVLLYQGDPPQGAPKLGSVNAGARNLPLVGLTLVVANFQDPICPIFPDSLKK